MKIVTVLAAAAAALLAVPAVSAAPAAPLSAPAAAEAPAQVVVVRERRSHRGYDQRRHHRRAYWRRVCTTKWRHGNRVRTCRRVRAWR